MKIYTELIIFFKREKKVLCLNLYAVKWRLADDEFGILNAFG